VLGLFPEQLRRSAGARSTDGGAAPKVGHVGVVEVVEGGILRPSLVRVEPVEPVVLPGRGL
jgi:hypothetical protein